ncbi:MAG: peroxiredoxin, Ohr subfamily [Ilumatobacteraceae bacterium]|nr:peroxiredoxin, Ohr subfamily [Ilumatobacteraceae bacterium]MCU1389122.1 peroxiredoxin, Ohr subfamily [Ilumatobacteraceae bacterium]
MRHTDATRGLTMKTLYTATATATGDGRNGHATSEDGILDLDLRIPTQMGGPGGATNPEQLFAVGYAACFHSALKVVAGQDKLDVSGTEVSASVGIGMLDNGGFGLEVELDVYAPGLERSVAEALVARAHEVCPYSNATRGNIEVKLTVI